MNIRRICFIAGGYPSVKNPHHFVFYKNLIHALVSLNIEAIVICPVPIIINKKARYSPRISVEKVNDHKIVKVFYPRTITFGAKRLFLFNTAILSSMAHYISTVLTLKQLKFKPDVLYSHFINPAGITAAKISKRYNIPSFVAYGESSPWGIFSLGQKRCQKVLSNVNGFIAVSKKNKVDLINLGIAHASKILVEPNSVDENIFYQRDRDSARKKLGWDKNIFIVAFAGHFNERKGCMRIAEAVKNNAEIHVAYAGDGQLNPRQNNVIFCGKVSPCMMPWFLSASDIFVLPTLAEGSCNAIIEAMACGLPIISSNKAFNQDILNSDNSILINPLSIKEIYESIVLLKNHPELRLKLSHSALATSKRYFITNRANRILTWMDGLISEK